MGTANRRLAQVRGLLTPSKPAIGTLRLGDISFDVQECDTPSRLPRSTNLLDLQEPANQDHLRFMLQKYVLGQDIFLVSQPGPYARRLAMTFCSLINSEYEFVALHRDVGETELKQGREIRTKGDLTHVDSAAVRAAKLGRVLILEGIEKAERGIMPVLNNLLENREMNLDDGTHIVHPSKFARLEQIDLMGSNVKFIEAHRNFRVIAIAAPVPPYPGHPLDPPFRSRFQSRFLDPIESSLALENSVQLREQPSGTISTGSRTVAEKVREIILSTQFATEQRHALETVSRSSLPPFPQTALMKLRKLADIFPPPERISPEQLAMLMLSLHPALVNAPFMGWAALSRQTEEATLGELGSPSNFGINRVEGLFGYRAVESSRADESTIVLTFERIEDGRKIELPVPAGPMEIRRLPVQTTPLEEYILKDGNRVFASPRFLSQLTLLLQAHALGWDISLIPPSQPSTASCSTSLLVKMFGEVLGYEMEDLYLYKELGGRELLMRREIKDGGATAWVPRQVLTRSSSPLTMGVWSGKLVHLSGTDVIGPTAGSLARLTQDREIELWEEKRVVGQLLDNEESSETLTIASPTFRVISTSSKSIPLRDWLTVEHSNMFFAIPTQPMDEAEEARILSATDCPAATIGALLKFANKYRTSVSAESVQKSRKLGTRSLVRIAKRVAAYSWDDDIYAMLCRAVLADFLPPTERMTLQEMLEEAGIRRRTAMYNPSPAVDDEGLLFFPEASDQLDRTQPVRIPKFDPAQDPEGVASHVPHMDHFFDNSLQTGLMRDMAVDLEILGEHLVLLGNQGVGKNKIIDRLCQLLGRPREYVQLHRDTTVNQLLFTMVLEGGVLQYKDSPLLRAITSGRVLIVDEADKAPEHVVAVFRSLAGQGEMTLSDGRRVRRHREREDDIVVHKNFRLILLANRPGYPFLGNHFLQVLGDNFSCHAVSNPDLDSERRLLQQLAPEIPEDTLLRLVASFQDLRAGYDTGKLTYPYSLRELINVVRHMSAYPGDSIEEVLRNVFDFDASKPDTMDVLSEVFRKHGLDVNFGLEAARESAKKRVKDIKFEPKGKQDLNGPKFGKEDPNNEEHSGGNTWAGGTGGRDTAGLGGKGGYMRLFKGHDIKQISDEAKKGVPDHVKEKAREMARLELARRLEELDMRAGDAKEYGGLLQEVQAHIAQLHDLLENLSAREEERVWIKRQTDGELDDSRLTEGITGEKTIYKRRGMEKPEMGRPQIKPKRIRFVFDVSGSMYRFQYDGRLQRSLETVVMLMETFDRLTRKDKYVWDIYGHSGDSPTIPLVEVDNQPKGISDRWKVVEKMTMISQYAFAGDYTIEAIEKAVDEVSKFDADDWFVIAISDANFGRYQITAEDLKRVLHRNAKVRTALICIGEGAEAEWIPRHFQGKGFRVGDSHDIPKVLRSILSSFVESR
ncbi:hypothetical protein SCHPADRAFT_935748 [Schizopora paradoxa]|uniref:ATPase dynein-related AAA domain-containing protein n=1 Tax=Schizopora paradoxa TaxID=27342 RepID=A0A0H2S4A1_9AGAM|nr:hypothetical protein SCHPADRAFT_935748 [Schizopora paradoxa]